MSWSAEHDGYEAVDTPATHRRTVRLLRQLRRLEVTDEVTAVGEHVFRLAFHLGPAVSSQLVGTSVSLRWPGARGQAATALLRLPAKANWRLARGEADPALGWYSPAFGNLVPTTTIVGSGECSGSTKLVTTIEFADEHDNIA